MSVSEESTTSGPARERSGPGGLDAAVAGLAGLFVLVAGIWVSVTLNDAGAFLVGIGAGLLLALIWRDALATALAAFLVAAALYAGIHAADLDGWVLGALAVLAAVALWRRLRRLGYVLGYLSSTTNPALAPFVGQKTVALDTYRRDGSAVRTPVSIAVDGDRAVVRSFEKAGKTRRLRRDPAVTVAPSTARGVPTGPGLAARARRLEGAEARAAARLLRRKYPVLHGVLVPLAHRAGRAKTGRTVHFELVGSIRSH